jgi:hypothetical protein
LPSRTPGLKTWLKSSAVAESPLPVNVPAGHRLTEVPLQSSGPLPSQTCGGLVLTPAAPAVEIDAKAEAERQAIWLARTGSLTMVSKTGDAPKPACSRRRREVEGGTLRPQPGAAGESGFLWLSMSPAFFANAGPV